MSNTTKMLMHGAVIGLIAYFVFYMGLKNPQDVSMRRAVLVALVATLYLVLYGYQLPKQLPQW